MNGMSGEIDTSQGDANNNRKTIIGLANRVNELTALTLENTAQIKQLIRLVKEKL